MVVRTGARQVGRPAARRDSRRAREERDAYGIPPSMTSSTRRSALESRSTSRAVPGRETRSTSYAKARRRSLSHRCTTGPLRHSYGLVSPSRSQPSRATSHHVPLCGRERRRAQPRHLVLWQRSPSSSSRRLSYSCEGATRGRPISQRHSTTPRSSRTRGKFHSRPRAGRRSRASFCSPTGRATSATTGCRSCGRARPISCGRSAVTPPDRSRSRPVCSAPIPRRWRSIRMAPSTDSG